MKKYKNSPYHICYVADDFDGDIDDLCQNKGYAQIGEPCIAPAMNKRRVVFLMHPDLGMIELVEKPI